MKFLEKKKIWFAALVISLAGCGAIQEQEESDGENDPTQLETAEDSFVTDSELSLEGASASLTDAAEALADANQASESAMSLNLAGSRERMDNSVFEKSCVDDKDGAEGSAIVSISASIDRERSFENRRRKISWSVVGSGSSTRSWSMADGEVNCNDAGTAADIDWKMDTTGLALDVRFERSREMEFSIESKGKGRSFSKKKKFEAEGKRSVDWLSQSDVDEDSIARLKEITSDVERVHKLKNSRGKERHVKLNVKTAEDAPLQLETIRGSDELELKSQELKSGMIIAERKGDGRVEATFDSLKAEFSEDECKFVSGTVNYKFYKEGEDEPKKNLQLTIADGDYTLVDLDTGDTIADFEFEGCNIRNYRH